jgi:formiminoglutamase
VRYTTYDSLKIRKEKTFNLDVQCFRIYKNDFFGIEIDLDAIPNIASSAMTLSGSLWKN